MFSRSCQRLKIRSAQLKITIDSSCLLAALARPGVCTQLLDEVLDSHELIISEYILAEVFRGLKDKFEFSTKSSHQIIDNLKLLATIVQPHLVKVGSCRDSEDLPILGTAISGEVDCLISVDKDLLVLKHFSGIPILKPGDFFKWIRAGG